MKKNDEVSIKKNTERKKDDKKFVKVFVNESDERFKEIGDRVSKKELKWAYFSTENSVGVHYYLILNTNKK